MIEDIEAKGYDRRLYVLTSPAAWTESYSHRYIDSNAPNQLDVHVRLGEW